MRLIRLTLVCVMLFAAAIGGAILVARQQPIPERHAILHLDDCSVPCWLGITPGKTTMEEATRHIMQVYGNSDKYHIASLKSITSDSATFIVKDQHGVVVFSIALTEDTTPNSIGFIILEYSQDSRRPTLAEFHRFLGIPEGVVSIENDAIAKFGLYYGNRDVTVWVLTPFDSCVPWEQTVTQYILSAPGYGTNAVSRWRGMGNRTFWRNPPVACGP